MEKKKINLDTIPGVNSASRGIRAVQRDIHGSGKRSGNSNRKLSSKMLRRRSQRRKKTRQRRADRVRECPELDFSQETHEVFAEGRCIGVTRKFGNGWVAVGLYGLFKTRQLAGEALWN